ncbi:MAG: glycoside hydrolase family 9 protein [Planctomycetes bacterium]|nr:glycoside hydrolase family 9 protein [Planctomycetota bacterium]
MPSALGLFMFAAGACSGEAAPAAHPADGPEVRHVCAVAPDILSITLQAGTYVPNSLKPYVPQPGDEIVEEPSKEKLWIFKDGKAVEDHDKAVFRTVDGKRTRVETLSLDGKSVYREGKMSGEILDEAAADLPTSYSVQSSDDPAFAKPAAPAAVFRKSKPNGSNTYPLPFVHTISLKLSAPLKEGAAYTIHFTGLNTSKERVAYVHEPRKIRSDAVHAIQTGYRPDDPYKRAYLSIWLGASAASKQDGGCTLRAESFELLDAASGKPVFTGKPELTKAEGAKEAICIHEEKDYLRTSAQRLDFSAFSTPGEYRVYVPGIGVSYPFRIAADVWEEPFKTAMHGILTQRQGLELGPPFSEFKRARAFHPDDGVEFYQLTIAQQEGQEGERGQNLLDLAKAGKLERVRGVWGGYQDAGDWDTLGHHLSLTHDLLELYELNPSYFAKAKLALPPDEQSNALPDLLDEALWQLPCFRRLQLPDGSVRGGYGEGWGARRAATSPMVKYAGIYAPDHITTYNYAACAAKAARILTAFDKKQAAEYLETARRAWTWAAANSNDENEIFRRLKKRDPGYPGQVKNARVLAAVELYAATREAGFHEAFKMDSELSKENPSRYLDQAAADFAYARLPDALADAAFKKRAIALFTSYVDYAIEFSRKNGYEIVNGCRTDLPIIGPCCYFTSPGVSAGYNIIRAYVLSPKPAYLAAAVQACNFTLGANPDNLSYCVGLGKKFVAHPLKLDAAVTGQLPGQPVGYIPFGQGDEGGKMCTGGNGWVEKWYLNYQAPKMFPDFYTWPAQECYLDVSFYAMMNENCVNNTTTCAAYYWGFLASRQ